VNKKILIIDDDISLKPLWEYVLSQHFVDAEIDWHIDIETAKQQYLKQKKTSTPYSLMIVDLFLSGAETGLDFLLFLQKKQETCPLLFVSAVDAAKLKEEVARFSLRCHVVEKPLQSHNLEKILQKMTLDEREAEARYD